MSIFCIILIIIVVAIVILLIAAAVSSGTYTIERSIGINKPQPDVFNYIKLVRNQEHYSKWVMLDPNSRKTTEGTDGTVGFSYAWDSDNKQVGKGVQTITAVNNEEVHSHVQFIKPFEGSLDALFSAVPQASSQTMVTWRITGGRNYMMCLFHIMLNLPKKLGDDMAESLNNLKAVLETK